MKEADLLALRMLTPIRVTASDYAYDGWLVSVFSKRRDRGAIRAVVEDANGRLFIHNAKQLEVCPCGGKR